MKKPHAVAVHGLVVMIKAIQLSAVDGGCHTHLENKIWCPG